MVDERASIAALLELDARITRAEEEDDVVFLRDIQAQPEMGIARSFVRMRAGRAMTGEAAIASPARAPKVIPAGLRTIARDVRLLGRHRGMVATTMRVADRIEERVRLFLRTDPAQQDWRLLMSASEEVEGIAPARPPLSLPEYLATAPARPEDWEPPTAWLLGAQIIGSLRRLILSTMHGGFDMRDWMAPGPLLSIGQAPGAHEHWIDYLSDTGDSPRLVHLLARALYQPALDAGGEKLPRGSLLLIGGDTAYPVADEVSLGERVQAPFVWAAQGTDLGDRRLLLGIPGNHDYYDMLDGFARQFRRPAAGEDGSARGDDARDRRPPPLQLPGFVRVQQASYFALGLPFGWQLWGLDVGSRADGGPIDFRQRQYFRSLPPASKLILATSKPLIVHRKPLTAGDPINDAITDLGLPAPHGSGGELPAEQLRLDLSGDTHVYERYFGATSGGTQPPGAEADAAARPNYAAVVSGLGGAFHHPEQVIHGNIAAQAAWPPPGESAARIGAEIMNPFVVFRAGSVWIIGALLGVLFFYLSAHRGAGSVLDAPLLIAHGEGGFARTALADLGRTALFIGAVILWMLLFRWAWNTSRDTRMLMIRDRAGWHAGLRLVDRLVQPAPIRRFIRLAGGNPRVAVMVTVVAPLWAVVIAAVYGLWRLDDLAFFSLGARPHVATHAIAAVLVIACAGLALINLGDLGTRTALIVGFGLVHGVLQVVTPFLWTRLVLEHQGWPLLLLAAYVPLYFALRPLARGTTWSRRVGLTLAWLVLAGLLVAAPLLLGELPPLVEERGWGYPIAAVHGAVFACLWVGWYFLVSLQWGGHGNEAGAAARIDRYAQFLRIKLTEDAAEVWCLAVAEPTEAGAPPVVTVIDRFRIARGEKP